jgi:hypothetical protein
MNNLRNKIVVLLLVALIASGCAGFAVGPADTATGLLNTVMGKDGTFIMESAKLYMLAWPESGGQYGFAVFTKTGESVKQFAELASCTATRAGCETMSDLVKYMKATGWTQTNKLPPALVAQITALAKYFGVAGAANTSYSFFVVPAGSFQFTDDVMLPQQIDG